MKKVRFIVQTSTGSATVHEVRAGESFHLSLPVTLELNGASHVLAVSIATLEVLSVDGETAEVGP